MEIICVIFFINYYDNLPFQLGRDKPVLKRDIKIKVREVGILEFISKRYNVGTSMV